MKALHNLYGKKLLPLTILLLLILSLFSAFNVNITRVSAVESPYIAVVPESTVDPTLTPGKNYTVSIYTDYEGPDITMYEFTLSYDPNVLHGGINNTDFWTGDGVTNEFNVTKTRVVQDSEKVYVNHTLMLRDWNYTIDYGIGEITFKLKTTDTWDGDGVTNEFNTTKTPVVPKSEKVYVNHTLMLRDWNYTIDYSEGEITFIRNVPGLGAEIEVTYNAPPGLGADITAMYLYNGVTNGDVVVPGPYNKKVSFLAGEFNNEAGKLSRTLGFFMDEGVVEPGPGTLAYVTFTVVGKGNSNITIGPETILWGWDDWDWKEYKVIEATTMPDNIQDGYFDNRFPHDVAVGNVIAPAGAAVGQLVPINVTVSNVGKSNENVEVTVSHDSVPVDTKQVLLLVGESKTVSLSWNTTDLEQGAYTINATATVPEEGDLTDNWNTTKVLLSLHNVVVNSVDAPAKAPIGDVVPINVTVSNIGASLETVNVTIHYDTTLIGFNDTVELPAQESTVVQFEWNTTDVTQGKYTINANATIAGDLDLKNNWKEVTILLTIHDVAVVDITAPETVSPGDIVPIGVEVVNLGTSPEEANVTIRYDTTLIGFNDTVELPAQESTVVQFEWNTTGLALGLYTINATVTIAVDDDPTDNWKNATILIAMHDVTVQSIMAPTSVYVGELATIWVLVKNLGWYEENFVVKVTYDTTGIIDSPKSVTLLSKDLENIEFSWNTTGVAPASYTITAEAILDGDANPTNNMKTRDIPVTVELPPGAIAGTVTDSSNNNPIEGANVTANGYSDITDDNGHYNITDVPVGTYTVTASAAKYLEQSKTVTLTAGTTTTLDFELALLNGTISGTVKDSSTGNPISEATVTTNGMSATTDSSGTYVISDVPVGTYNVTVSADGYQSSSQTDITVTAGETTIADFELTPVQPLNLLLYATVAAVAIVFIAGTAVYIFKIRKPT